MSRRSKPAPRYRVRHTFAHRGVLYGPWNAEEVSDLPAHLRDSLEERGRIEALPAAGPESDPEPTHEA